MTGRFLQTPDNNPSSQCDVTDTEVASRRALKKRRLRTRVRGLGARLAYDPDAEGLTSQIPVIRDWTTVSSVTGVRIRSRIPSISCKTAQRLEGPDASSSLDETVPCLAKAPLSPTEPALDAT